MQNTISEHYIGWTQTRITLQAVAQGFTEEAVMDTHLTREQIQQLLSDLGDAANWPFLHTVETDSAEASHLYSLELYELWCNDLANMECAWSPFAPTCPRVFYRERVILHAYSGRRRPGDFQWFVDKIAETKHLQDVMVVSVDLVIDSTWGDISQPSTQKYWLEAMGDGYVIGMLSGPPCCTWSMPVARSFWDHTSLFIEDRGSSGPGSFSGDCRPSL